MAMLHAVPSALAKNRDLAGVYTRHWNKHVSPGEAVFAHRGDGQRIVEQARHDGHVPRSKVHEKEIFR